MNCNEFQKKIDLFIDGLLSKEEENQMKEHLQSCADCEERYELTLWMKEELSDEPTLPEGFKDRVMETVRTEGKIEPFPVKKKRFYPMPFTVIAAVLALVVGVGGARFGWFSEQLSPRVEKESGAPLELNKASQFSAVPDSTNQVVGNDENVIPVPATAGDAENLPERSKMGVEENPKSTVAPTPDNAEPPAAEQFGISTTPDGVVDICPTLSREEALKVILEKTGVTPSVVITSAYSVEEITIAEAGFTPILVTDLADYYLGKVDFVQSFSEKGIMVEGNLPQNKESKIILIVEKN